MIRNAIVKNLVCIILLGLSLSCNNTGTTAAPNDLDKTDVDDSASAGSNLPRHDTLDATKETMAVDSLK